VGQGATSALPTPQTALASWRCWYAREPPPAAAPPPVLLRRPHVTAAGLPAPPPRAAHRGSSPAGGSAAARRGAWPPTPGWSPVRPQSWSRGGPARKPALGVTMPPPPWDVRGLPLQPLTPPSKLHMARRCSLLHPTPPPLLPPRSPHRCTHLHAECQAAQVLAITQVRIVSCTRRGGDY